MSSETYLSEKRKFKNLDEAKVINRVNTQLSQVPSSFFLLLAGGLVGLLVGLAVSQKKKKINQLKHTSLLH